MAEQFSVHDGIPWKTAFFAVWGGQAFSILGSQLVQFALIWYLATLTGSATVLATATLAGMLPGVILGPIVGALVDRWNRKLVMVLADSLVALATVFLAVLFYFDMAGLLPVYAVMSIRSLAGSFHANAMNASTSLMVPVEGLARIQGLNQMLNGGLNIVSAPLGALLLGVFPLYGILAIDVVTAILAIVPLLATSIPEPDRMQREDSRNGAPPTVWHDFMVGLRYVLRWPGLLLVGLLTVGINFTVIPAFSLLPLLVKDHFGGTVIQLGLVESAMGIGVFAGGAVLGVWGGFSRKLLTSLVALMGMGAGTLMLGFAPPSSIVVAAGGVFLVGFMSPITNGPLFAVIQSTVEPGMQARVLSLLGSVGTAMVPLGLMIAGPVAGCFGVQAWFMVGGLTCMLMGLAGLFIPAVMGLEDGRREQNENRLYGGMPPTVRLKGDSM